MPVSNPTDKAEENALPDPKLNPLLNPLLAAHMGRWAEVYFTTPPERREQAVADLLKELEATSPAQFDSRFVDNATGTGEINTLRESDRERLDWPPEPVKIGAICSACGHQNEEGHRFCGMCGAPVDIPPDEPIAEIERPDPIEPASWAKPSLDTNPVDYAIEPDYRFPAVREYDDTVEPARPPANYVPHHIPYGTNDVPHFAVESKPVPYRYRIYVGVGLAILLAVLAYMARRGTEALSGAGQSPPSRIIPAAQPGPATSEPPPAARSATPEEKVEKAEKKENVRKEPAQDAKLPEASSPKQTTAVRPAPRMVPVAANSASLSLEQSGAQDLATAEGYLNGNQGKTRDSREAAQWLWKAVGKGNPAATIVLSDLYLRGEGVPKSCDQARLLLDAASRKGVKAAADRLRDLQAFGCQ
jgi:zinc ribbon protein